MDVLFAPKVTGGYKIALSEKVVRMLEVDIGDRLIIGRNERNEVVLRKGVV